MQNSSVPLTGDEIEVGVFRLSVIARRLIIDSDKIVRLTPKEARILAMLLQAPERIITAETLLEKIWNYSGDKSALTSAIHRLRRKIEVDPRSPQYLQQHGEGYVLFPFL
jgi:DNA-binding response OmpR family regulator